jgi:hypothetical protein
MKRFVLTAFVTLLGLATTFTTPIQSMAKGGSGKTTSVHPSKGGKNYGGKNNGGKKPKPPHPVPPQWAKQDAQLRAEQDAQHRAKQAVQKRAQQVAQKRYQAARAELAAKRRAPSFGFADFGTGISKDLGAGDGGSSPSIFPIPDPGKKLSGAQQSGQNIINQGRHFISNPEKSLIDAANGAKKGASNALEEGKRLGTTAAGLITPSLGGSPVLFSGVTAKAAGNGVQPKPTIRLPNGSPRPHISPPTDNGHLPVVRPDKFPTKPAWAPGLQTVPNLGPAKVLADVDSGTMTKTSGSDGGNGGDGSGSNGGDSGRALPGDWQTWSDHVTHYFQDKGLAPKQKNHDDDPSLTKNTGNRSPQRPQSGSDSKALSNAVVSRATQREGGKVSPNGPTCGNFVQEVLSSVGADPGHHDSTMGKTNPAGDTFGRPVSAAEVRAGDIVTIPPGATFFDGNGTVQYTVDDNGPNTGHAAIIINVSGDVYTVVDQDNRGGGPTQGTMRLPDMNGVRFFRPVYP